MRRWLLLAAFSLVSCTGGQLPQTCPDGEPVNVLKNVEDAYPAYVKEYETNFSVVEKLISEAQASATVKTKAVRLRQELDPERIELENQQKSVIIALQTAP